MNDLARRDADIHLDAQGVQPRTERKRLKRSPDQQKCEFWATLFRNVPPSAWVEFRWLPRKGSNAVVKREWLQIENLSKLAPVDDIDQDPRYMGVYVGINPRKERGKGKAKGILCIGALFADIDWGPGKPHATRVAAKQALQSFPLKPTIVVFTGHGYHAHWVLDPPLDCSHWEKARELMQRLHVAVGSDPVDDVPRLARLPGTTNRKKPNDEHLVELILASSERRFGLSDFESVLPEPPPKIQPAQKSSVAVVNSDVSIPSGSRHTVLTTFGARFRNTGATGKEIPKLLRVINESRCLGEDGKPEPVTDEELDKIAEWFTNKNSRNPVSPAPTATSIRDLRADHLAELRKRRRGEYKPFKTGLASLDNLLGGGIPVGQTTILAAAPGTGKSSLALDIALQTIALGRPVLIVAAELGIHDTLDRFTSFTYSVPWNEARNGEHYNLSKEFFQQYEGRPLYLQEKPKLEDLRREVQNLQSRHKQNPLVVIDYVQLLAQAGAKEVRPAVDVVADAMCELARQQESAVLLLASVSRAAYNVVQHGRPDIVKVLSMAKESGRFESDAAVVLGISLPNTAKLNVGPRDRRGWIVVAKNRLGGSVGTTPVSYDGLPGRFRELDDEEVSASVTGPDDDELLEEMVEIIAAAKPPLRSIEAIRKPMAIAKERVRRFVTVLIDDGRVEKINGNYIVPTPT